MTLNFACLFDGENIAPWPVSLSEGNVTYAKRKGKAKMETTLILDNILFIPKLICQLMR